MFFAPIVILNELAACLVNIILRLSAEHRMNDVGSLYVFRKMRE